jgi:hypothetical protein
MPNRFIAIETVSGETAVSNGLKVTPFSQVFRIQLPGGRGGLVWNRPRSVLVDVNGEETVLPVVDVTRLVQWSLYGLSFVLPLAVWLLSRKTSKK